MSIPRRTRPQRVIFLVLGIALVILGALFAVVGLNDADKYASIVGALAGVAGFGVAVAALRGRADGQPDPEGAVRQRVSNSRIGGDAVQLSRVSGNFSYRRTNTQQRSGDTPEPANSTLPDSPEGDQTITGSSIQGTSLQIDQVGGDVDVDGTT